MISKARCSFDTDNGIFMCNPMDPMGFLLKPLGFAVLPRAQHRESVN
jgi:hypothetical protein